MSTQYFQNLQGWRFYNSYGQLLVLVLNQLSSDTFPLKNMRVCLPATQDHPLMSFVSEKNLDQFSQWFPFMQLKRAVGCFPSPPLSPLLTYTNPVSILFSFMSCPSAPYEILMVFCWIWCSIGREENWMQNSRCALTAGISSLDLLAVHVTQSSPWPAFIAGSWHCSWMKLDVLIIWRRLSLKVKYFRNFKNNIWKKIPNPEKFY